MRTYVGLSLSISLLFVLMTSWSVRETMAQETGLVFETVGLQEPSGYDLSSFPFMADDMDKAGSASEEYLHERARRHMAHSLVVSGFLGYMIYGYFVFWDDVEYQEFYVSDWNDTYQRTYAGGSDKVSHAFGGYLITRTASQLYTWSGMPRKKASWLGFTIAQTLLLLGEIEDGFTLVYGFDTVDLTANLIGGALGVFEELHPRFDQCFDFRISYWPSSEYRNRDNFDNIAEDYSGQEFYFVGRLPDDHVGHQFSWLNYLELYAGFRTRGYMPGYKNTCQEPKPGYSMFHKERELLLGISLNIRRVIDRMWPEQEARSGGTTRSLVNYLFEFYQHPLKVGGNMDLSSSRWYYTED
ncbi:DUF2279 domain-containing protein [bacterium]|nr:DUF2279 domain-containing protein [bacterium]